jgi:hypothetical protein
VTALEDRVAALERRMAELEAGRYRGAVRPTQPGLTFAGGFTPGERVTLYVGHPASEIEVPAAPAVDADAAGRAVFDLSAVRVEMQPPPERRVYRARGESSQRVVERPV